jgi:hypothetical protein
VLDAGGRVKAFQKQDGAALVRFEIAYGEAFAALALHRSSRQVLQKAKEKPAFMQSLAELGDGPLFLERGGQLIRDATGGSVGALASPATSTRSMTSAPAFMPGARADADCHGGKTSQSQTESAAAGRQGTRGCLISALGGP